MGPGSAFYVGDHPTDTMCVARARREVAARGLDLDVWSIAALYGGESPDGWPEAPDFLAETPEDIVAIVDHQVPCRPVREEQAANHDLEEAS